MTDVDLENFLKSRNIEYELIRHGKTYRADEASKELGIPISDIVKSVLFMTSEGKPVLVIVRGDKRVDQGKLARKLGTRKLRLATRDELLRISGYEAGAVPPVGHINKIPTLIDNSIPIDAWVYAGGGSIGSSLKIKLRDIVQLQNASFTDCIQDQK